MASKNGRNVKIFSGITLFAIAAAMGIYFNLTDRASESGEAKATIKMQVEKVTERVDHLEGHAQETEAILNGKDGLVASVEVIKNEIENIKAQGTLIIQMIEALPKK